MNILSSTRSQTRSVAARVFTGALMLLAIAPIRTTLAADDPFAPLRTIPDTVDAAAVFNNPARTLLLSDPGRSVRSLLAQAGIFTHTEHAWEALAQALGDDTDQTITDLLGQRVVVVWDGVGAGPASVTGLADALDTRWALMCEVDQSYLKQIRNRLRPVKRDIVQGRPIYAIEQGRYGIVLLDAPDANHPARVLLAPSDGTKLLGQMLASTLRAQGSAGGGAPPQSIMHGRNDLVAQLSTAQAQGITTPWAVAWLIQTDRLSRDRAQPKANATPSPAPSRPANHALAGLMSLDSSGMRVSFASDLTLAPGLGDDAPVGLLDAVGDDAVLAFASARSPSMLVGGRALSVSLSLSDPLDPTRPVAVQPEHDALLDAPGLVVLSRIDHSPLSPHATATDHAASDLALSVLLRPRDKQPDEHFATRADETMHELISAYDPEQAPAFQGCFPDAVRTQSITIKSATPPAQAHATGGAGKTGKGDNIDTKMDPALAGPAPMQTAWSWPGTRPTLSWITGDLRHAQIMVASLAPQGCDTASRVRALSQAAFSLDALDAEPNDSGVLLRGYFRPARAIELMGDASIMDLAISRFIEKISCEMTRSPSGGVRGTFTLELKHAPTRTNLGNGND